MDYMSGDRNTLYKMKELWAYLGTSFTNPERYMKKSESLSISVNTGSGSEICSGSRI